MKLPLTRADEATPPPGVVAARSQLAWDPHSRRLLNGGPGGFVLWQLPERALASKRIRLAQPGLDPRAAVSAVAWSPDGRFIAWAGLRPALETGAPRRRGAWVIEAATGAEVSAPLAGETVLNLALSGDSTALLAATPTEIRCASPANGAPQWTVPHTRRGVGRDAFPPALAAAPAQPLAAMTLEKESISLVDLHTGEVKLTLHHPVSRPVAALAFSRDGARIACVAGHFVQTWLLPEISAALREAAME